MSLKIHKRDRFSHDVAEISKLNELKGMAIPTKKPGPPESTQIILQYLNSLQCQLNV